MKYGFEIAMGAVVALGLGVFAGIVWPLLTAAPGVCF